MISCSSRCAVISNRNASGRKGEFLASHGSFASRRMFRLLFSHSACFISCTLMVLAAELVHAVSSSNFAIVGETNVLDSSSDAKLPACKKELLKLRTKSLDCFKNSFGSSGEGVCASDCCCDFIAGDFNETRLIGAVGSCLLRHTTSKDSKAVTFVMLPLSPLDVAQASSCRKNTRDICGIVGAGCKFDVHESQAETGKEQSPDSKRNKTEEGRSDDKIRNKVLLAVGVLVGISVIFAAALWYIILPWLRGSTDEVTDADTEDDVAGDRDQGANRKSVEE